MFLARPSREVAFDLGVFLAGEAERGKRLDSISILCRDRNDFGVGYLVNLMILLSERR